MVKTAASCGGTARSRKPGRVHKNSGSQDTELLIAKTEQKRKNGNKEDCCYAVYAMLKGHCATSVTNQDCARRKPETELLALEEEEKRNRVAPL
jgi:hypothetical protein